MADVPDWIYGREPPSRTLDELIGNDAIRNSSQIYPSEAQNPITGPFSNAVATQVEALIALIFMTQQMIDIW